MKNLTDFIATLISIRVQDEESICKLRRIESVVIVGSTCSGKTTIADSIRKSFASQRENIEVPLRYITRPKRQNDNTIENKHISTKEFFQNIINGDIGLHWVRIMEGDRKESYGFKKVAVGKLPIYSANNAIFNNPNSVSPDGILLGALFLGVFAPDEIRKERLLRRSPDLLKDHPEELLYRLNDSSNNIFPHIHVAIHNYGSLEKHTMLETIKLVEYIVTTQVQHNVVLFLRLHSI